ncbi:MAG: domain S-box/diguanylate cyclase protein [Actinomycetia bacterium]|nr:domain S-box/diguanylate cyclase protein [Actinomycetes bacterium]
MTDDDEARGGTTSAASEAAPGARRKLSFEVYAAALDRILGGNGRPDPGGHGVADGTDPVVRRDTAGQRAADVVSARSLAALRAVVQSSPLALFAVDRAGGVQLWSSACEELFGWSADEALGQRALIGDESAVFQGLCERAFAGEVIRNAEIRLRHRYGAPIEVSISVAPIRDVDGTPVTVMAVAADVTDRNRAEEALRSSGAWFRSLVQHSADFVIVVDANAQVMYASPSVASFTGSEMQDLSKVDVRSAIHPDDVARLEAGSRDVAPGASTGPLEVRARHRDGTWRSIELVLTNLLDDPDVRGFVTNARDVTARVQDEAALHAVNDALVEVNETLSAIVENSPVAMYAIDHRGLVILWNPAAEELFGLSSRDMIGSREPFGPLPAADPLGNAYGRILDGEAIDGVEARRFHALGHALDVRLSAAPLRDAAGSMTAMLVMAGDVSRRKQAEDALRTSESRYRAIVHDQNEAIIRTRPDGRLTFANETYVRTFGVREHELIGELPSLLVPEDDRRAARREFGRLGPGRPVGITEHRVILPDGSLRWQQWTNRAIFDADGGIVEYQSVGRDITDQRAAEQLVADQARILELIAKGAALPQTLSEMCRIIEAHVPGARSSILLVEETGGALRVGAAPSLDVEVLRAIDPLPIEADAGSCGAAAFSGEPVVTTEVATDFRWERFRDLAEAHRIRASWSVPIPASTGDRVLGTVATYYEHPGQPPAEHLRIVDLVVHLAAIAIERKAFESRLAHQAHHDPLTGLPNRALFLEFLVLALARARRYESSVAVLFLDLDRFKIINDSLGHDAGDETLLKVVERLQSVVRPGDTVARFGGDEFTILCEDLDRDAAEQQAIEVAERLIEAVHQPFELAGDVAFLGASIGISIAQTAQERPEALLRDADAAMYRAKELGKGRWELFDENMRATARARLDTENALHRAIDREEFRIHYQPIVSLADGRCVGAEALVRWQHPERGLVPPGEFVGVGEETGLIVPIGALVIQDACEQAARWKRERDHIDDPFVVSVNLSARQLAQTDLVGRVADVLDRTGIEPGSLGLEITESVLLDDSDSTVGSILALKQLGVRLSIDDFGTGYSSVGYLKRFPVDAVKVDRSFVGGLGTDPEDTAIVAAVISLGHALGLTVVAEGVETRTQLDELIALGCDQAQGFYFQAPEPATARPAWFRAERWLQTSTTAAGTRTFRSGGSA